MNLQKSLQKNLRFKVKVIVIDLSEAKKAPLEIFNELENEKIEIEYLVNNATGGYGNYYETDWKKENDMIQTGRALLLLSCQNSLFTVTSPFSKLTREKLSTLPLLLRSKPGPLMSIYYATKAFVLSLSEAMAYELKDTNVSVTCYARDPQNPIFKKPQTSLNPD